MNNELRLILTIDGKEAVATISNVDNQFKQLQQTTVKTTTSMQGMTRGSSSMNQAMGQLGYTVGDANMFMVDFRMGMMSIGNNIPIVVESFKRAKDEAAAMGTTISKTLVTSLMGAGGLMIAINGVMFLMQVLPELFGKTTESIEEQKKAVDELKDAYQKLTTQQLRNEESRLKAEIGTLAGQSVRERNEDKRNELVAQTGELEKQLKVVQKQLLLVGDLSSLDRERQQILDKISQLRGLDPSGVLSPHAEESLRKLNEQLAGIESKIKRIKGSKSGGSSSGTSLDDRATNEANWNVLSGDADGTLSKDMLDKALENYASYEEGKTALQAKFSTKRLKEIEKENQKYNEIYREGINLLSGGTYTLMSEAWRKVFGDANSFFEIFMSNMLSRLAEMAVTNLLLGIFTGGSSLAVGAGMGLMGSSVRGGDNTLLNEIRSLNKNLTNMSFVAYVSEKEFNRASRNYNTKSRKSVI